ncbi:MAG: rhamnogalacturonan acetylesterase [Lentisphaerae bacterium]|nr:rhamnogalacturonan acetylesterase [Lentisphaerota bacterium]
MKKFALLAVSLLSTMLMAVDVYLAGDSTMATYPPERAPLTGWGAVLHLFAKDGVTIHNHATGGRSSKSFRSEGRWDAIINQVKPGDFVVIQFGHNDSATGEQNLYRYADPRTDFPANLRRFIAEVRAKGATPVLLPLTVCAHFNAKGESFLTSTQRAYYDAACEVARTENVEFIDCTKWMLAEFTRMGKEAARNIFLMIPAGQYPAYPDGKEDGIHFQRNGALFVAAGIIQLAKEQNLSFGNLFNTTAKAE